jgi:hypothetical protein
MQPRPRRSESLATKTGTRLLSSSAMRCKRPSDRHLGREAFRQHQQLPPVEELHNWDVRTLPPGSAKTALNQSTI